MSGAYAKQQTVSPLGLYLTKKQGVSPTKNEMNNISDTVVSTFTDMSDMLKAKTAASTMKSLLADEKPEQPDPYKSMQSVMGMARDMAGIDESRTRNYREELQREREQRQKIEEQTSQMAQKTDGSMAQMMMGMFQMVQQTNQQWQERLEQRERHHKEEIQALREEVRRNYEGGSKKSDPYNELAQEALKERLNYQPPDPVQQFQQAKQLIDTFQPAQPSTGGNAQLEYDLALRRMDLDAQLKREEYEERRALEERKLQNQEKIANTLGSIFSGFMGPRGQGEQSQQSQQRQQNRPTGTGGMPSEMHRFRCQSEDCGKEWTHPHPKYAEAGGLCPECKSGLEYIGKEA